MLSGAPAALADGLSRGALLGVHYNPAVAAATTAVASALVGYRGAPAGRVRTAALLVVVGWLAGDGLRVLARAHDVVDGVVVSSGFNPAAPTVWLTLAVWAALGLAAGYAGPTVVGAAVGRRVTHGTGWLAAATVAAVLAVTLSAIVGGLA